MRKNSLAALAALLIAAALASCDSATGQTNPNDVHAEIMDAQPETKLLPAQNITQKPAYVSANYASGGAAIYADGQASITTDKLAQTEIFGGVHETAGGAVICSNGVTGDYVEVNPFTGVTTAKIAGRMIVLLPENGTAFAASQE